MPDTVSSDTIQALADKLADFAEGLTPDEQEALDRFFLQKVDGDDVQGFGIELDAVLAAKQHERDELQAKHSDTISRRNRYAATLRKAMEDEKQRAATS